MSVVYKGDDVVVREAAYVGVGVGAGVAEAVP